MPITFHYDQDANMLYEYGIGELTADDFSEYRKKIGNANLKRNFKCLSDYSQSTINFTQGQMRDYANSYRGITEKYGKIKVAILVADKFNHGYGMARMFESLTESDEYQIEIFQDIEAAKKWLDIK